MGWVGRGGSELEGRREKGKRGRDGRRCKKKNFQNFEIITASMICGASLHHRAKFRAVRSSREIWRFSTF